MFTGIVEETGTVAGLSLQNGGGRLTISARHVLEDLQPGDSLAVNGCCLTAAELSGDRCAFDLLAETMDRTNLGNLREGSLVNLERPLKADGRLGGHFVQGHIDCASRVRGMEPQGADHRLELELPAEFSRYTSFKGSIAVNGVSLTIAELHEEGIVIWLIPHTCQVTNLGVLKPGDPVNLEFDLLAKYLDRLLAAREMPRPA